MTYTATKVLQIINDYHININNVHEYNHTDNLASVGVAQMSSLPSAGGISDQVANQAIKLAEDGTYFAEVATDIKYLHDRLYRITDERESQVLSLRLQGYSSLEISSVVDISRRTVDRELSKVAMRVVTDN